MSSTLKESTKKKKHAQVSTNSAPKTASTVNGKAAHIKASQQKVAERRKREETDEDTEKDSEGHSDDSEFDDVDEVGMNRLMELLGDDGLDDIAKLQLGIIDNEEHEDEGGEVAEDDSEAEEEEEGREHEGSEQGENFEASGDSDALVDEEEQEIDLEDVSSIDEDVVPKQKLIINNTAALDRIRENIQLDPSLPWMETLAVSYDQAIEVDVNDDLKRELEFYKQALHGANLARSLAAKHQLPFTRPSDFYAEMVKSDAHMERIRQRLLDETAGIKRSEEKKREREGKKFGKQVQMEKIKERERTKKDMEDRIRGLKRKRKDALDGDEFD
ncbi:rRNA-processing protein and EBNA1-binding protein ebp2, partial [Serendipita sp. 399]